MVHPTDGTATPTRNVRIRDREGGLHSIDETHRAFDAMHFVLLMPYGEDGWSTNLALRPRSPIATTDANGVVVHPYPTWNARDHRWETTDGQPAPAQDQPRIRITKDTRVSCRACASRTM